MAIEFIHSVEVEGSLTVEGKIINTGGGDSGNWDTAYSWGNHADAGYVKSSGVTTEADPIYTKERDDLRFNKMTHSTLLFSTLEHYNKPSGYSTMIQPASHNNPLPSHGYYHVIGRRDGAGGYGALLQAYSTHQLFHGITTENTKEISWYNVWNSGDFAKQDVTEGATAYSWGDHGAAGYLSSSNGTFSGTVTVGQHLKATGSNLSFSAGGNQILNIDLNGKVYPHSDNSVDLGFATDKLRFRHGNFSGTVTADGGDSTSWNTAYGWGNHASEGYLTLAGGTMDSGATITTSGTLSIIGSSDVKLRLSKGARIQLENADVTDSFYISNTGGNLASTLDLGGTLSIIEGGASTFSNSVNTGGLVNQVNSNAGTAAYVTRKWTNDVGNAEIWRNSSTRTQTGGAAQSFNIYNNKDTNIWSGGTRAVNFNTSQNATFAANVTIGNTLFVPEFISHLSDTNNFIRFQASRMILQTKASGSAKIDLHDNGQMYLNSGGGTALTLDTSQNATFGGSLDVNGTASDISFVGGSMNFKDSNDYIRITKKSASAQIGLFREGDGGMYIGASKMGFRLYTEEFSQKLLIDQSGNATFSGSLSATGYNKTNWDNAYGYGNHASAGYLTSLPSHNHDDRYYTESEINGFFNRGYIQSFGAGNLAIGWYTIATNTGDRAMGEFQIWDTASSDHQSVLFNASHHFGQDFSNDITILNQSRYSGTNFRYIRIKDHSTYAGAAIQVYIDGTSNSVKVAIVGGNAQEAGWVIKDWIPDNTDPGDVTEWESFGERTIVDLDLMTDGGILTTGKIFAGSQTKQNEVYTTETGAAINHNHDSTYLKLSGGTITGNSTFEGDVSVEDNLYLTDAGTNRAKIQLNSSDRDNLDIKAVSLGSTMNFFTADTLALGLDASQNATFAGTVTATNLSGTSSGTNTGDQSLVGLLSKDKDDTTTGTITFGPNKTWGKYLTIGGDSNHSTDDIASIGTTDGNLHLDAATKHSTYLNYYDGQGGVAFGSGAGGVVAWMGADGDLWKGASDNSGSRYLHQGDITSTQISNWDTAYGYGNHASAGYLKRTKPEEPKLDSKIVGETIEVIITASGTSNIDQYLVFSSIVGSDYGLIAVLSPEDFKAEMTVVDSKFDKGGKIDYRVYAVKQGVYSSVSTTTQTFSVGTLEPTNVSVISLNTAHYIQWDAPSSKSRFVKNYEVYHHEHDTEGSLSRDSATKIYSGLNTSFMREESDTKFHQFWVEIDEA